jgi:hypothetical protein
MGEQEQDEFKARIGRLFDRHGEGKQVAANVSKAMREKGERALAHFRDKLHQVILPTLCEAQESSIEARRMLTVKHDDGSSTRPAMALIGTKDSWLEFRADINLGRVDIYREINRPSFNAVTPAALAFLPIAVIDRETVQEYVERFILLLFKAKKLQ